ncbi:hypothetical protein B0H14DRAFT_2577204 [Mycena olivaceomarginata]|nr:hypothetical protein B0H14DRAFT_2577204 [Mycena olivaceomarginata]
MTIGNTAVEMNLVRVAQLNQYWRYGFGCSVLPGLHATNYPDGTPGNPAGVIASFRATNNAQQAFYSWHTGQIATPATPSVVWKGINSVPNNFTMPTFDDSAWPSCLVLNAHNDLENLVHGLEACNTICSSASRNSTFISAWHLKFDLCSCNPWIAWSFGRIFSASKSSVLAISMAKGFPSTRFIIRDETFVIPISSWDLAFLASHLGTHIIRFYGGLQAQPQELLTLGFTTSSLQGIW